MGPTCRPQVGPMLAPRTLLSGLGNWFPCDTGVAAIYITGESQWIGAQCIKFPEIIHFVHLFRVPNRISLQNDIPANDYISRSTMITLSSWLWICRNMLWLNKNKQKNRPSARDIICFQPGKINRRRYKRDLQWPLQMGLFYPWRGLIETSCSSVLLGEATKHAWYVKWF